MQISCIKSLFVSTAAFAIPPAPKKHTKRLRKHLNAKRLCFPSPLHYYKKYSHDANISHNRKKTRKKRPWPTHHPCLNSKTHPHASPTKAKRFKQNTCILAKKEHKKHVQESGFKPWLKHPQNQLLYQSGFKPGFLYMHNFSRTTTQIKTFF